MMIANLDHRRMEKAVAFVDEAAQNNASFQKKYRTRVISCGTQIHTMGLFQTIAFFLSKFPKNSDSDERATVLLAEQLLRFITHKYSPPDDEYAKNVIRPILQAGQLNGARDPLWDVFNGIQSRVCQEPTDSSYLSARAETQNIQSLLVWMRRFVEARFESE